MQLFGFNKTKTMASAEKFVQQGKIQNAISEYEKVLKHDPKDLNVVNTVGDLYMKLGQIEQAVVQFKTVGDAYAADGFLLRAIAIYKKITKADASSPEHVVRLAELYHQQNLHHDARQQFAAAAELLLKQGKNDEAVRLFAKIVESDPENTAVRLKVGELYLKVGNKAKARDMFFEAAHTLIARGSFDGALAALDKVQQAVGQDAPATILKARAYRELGRTTEAIGVLKAVPELEKNAEALKSLLSAHTEVKDFESADLDCERLLNGFSDAAGFKKYVGTLVEVMEARRAVHLCHRNLQKFATLEAGGVSDLLLSLINPNREHAPELEMLRELLRQNQLTSHDG
ncbi:MAG TPA: tetratricopeptide repeat protein, partial [Terriglobales bacterium]